MSDNESSASSRSQSTSVSENGASATTCKFCLTTPSWSKHNNFIATSCCSAIVCHRCFCAHVTREISERAQRTVYLRLKCLVCKKRFDMDIEEGQNPIPYGFKGCVVYATSSTSESGALGKLTQEWLRIPLLPPVPERPHDVTDEEVEDCCVILSLRNIIRYYIFVCMWMLLWVANLLSCVALATGVPSYSHFWIFFLVIFGHTFSPLLHSWACSAPRFACHERRWMVASLVVSLLETLIGSLSFAPFCQIENYSAKAGYNGVGLFFFLGLVVYWSYSLRRTSTDAVWPRPEEGVAHCFRFRMNPQDGHCKGWVIATYLQIPLPAHGPQAQA